MATTIEVARLVAPLIVETGEFQKGLDGAINQAKGWGDSLQAVGTVALGAVTAGAVAAAGAVVGIGAALAGLAIEAAPLEGIGIAFEAMAGDVGLSLDALRTAAAGTVADFDLMKAANVALTGAGEDLGVAMGQELPALLEIARSAARATGQDVDFLFNSLVSGVKRSSPMLIDNTGLVLKLGEANEAMAASLGKSVEDLTAEEKQIALLNATVEAGQKMIDQFGGGQVTAAERMAQFQATMQNTKDTLGLALLPVLDSVMQTFSAVAERILPPLVELFETKLVPMLETAAFFFDSLVAAILSGKGPVDAFTGALRDIGLDELAVQFEYIIEQIQAFLEQVWQVMEPVVDWIAQNVELQDVLIALSVVIASVVVPAVWAMMAPFIEIIAIFALIVAAVALLRAVWESDFLGIRTALTDFWEGVAQPALEQLWVWLQVNIPAAIETLRGFWEGVLLPAMQNIWAFISEVLIPIFTTVAEIAIVVVGAAITQLTDIWQNVLYPVLVLVWDFIQGSVMPLFSALADLAQAVLGLAITVLAGIWDTVLYPALSKVWDFISGNIIPIFTEAAGAAQDKLGPPLEWLAGTVLPTLENAFEAVADAVQWVIDKIQTAIDWVNKMAKAAEGLFESPQMKLEIGFIGVAEAVRQLTDVEFPRLEAQLGQLAAPTGLVAMGAGGGDTYYEFSQTIHDASPAAARMGFEEIRAMVGA